MIKNDFLFFSNKFIYDYFRTDYIIFLLHIEDSFLYKMSSLAAKERVFETTLNQKSVHH